MRNQTGQVILVLILIITVALAIGLSVIQRSLSDVSTSSKVEQSSRAFSAAEAGIEKALKGDYSGVNFTENNSSARVTDKGLIPIVGQLTFRQDPLEYPALSKEEVAHIWLADPNADLPTCTPTDVCYKQDTLEVYWGNSTTDRAALELILVYWNGASYQSRKWYLDQTSASRSSPNGFEQVNCTGNYSLAGYQCKYVLGDSSDPGGPLPASIAEMMLLRARLLYNSSSQSLAIWVPESATCGAACSIPPQARNLVSTGTSGTTQRKVKLFQIDKVVPPYFDYAIFSTSDINK